MGHPSILTKALHACGVRLPEANIQAEFYHHAKILGINAVLELSTPVGRLDIAVLDGSGSNLIAVVECKSNDQKVVTKTNQIRRYMQIGVPVYGLADIQRAEHLVCTIKEKYIDNKAYEGKPLSEIFSMPRVHRRLSYRSRYPDLNIKNG